MITLLQRPWARFGCIALFVVLACLWWNRNPERRWGWFSNQHAHCTGCSAFLVHNLRDYSHEHDGWFPKGGNTPVASLGQSLLPKPRPSQMSHYTSHALAGLMWEHYSRHGVLAEEFCAFGYNEGLREEDSGDLVLVYGRMPTKWQTKERKGTVLGRNVLTTQLGHFQFYKEADFQTMQARTEAFLRDRKERANAFALVATNLVISVNRAVLGTNQFRFTATLKNQGTKAAQLVLTKDGEMLLREGQSGGPNFLAKSGDEFLLDPGHDKLLPGWCEASVNFVVKEGKVIGREISHRSLAGLSGAHSELTNTGRGSTGFGPNADTAEALREMTVQAVLWARVNMDGVPPLETVLKSPVLRYMTDSP